MVIIPGNKVAYCDVDDTLVAWESSPEDKAKHGVTFEYPQPSGCQNKKEFELLVPNLAQVEQLKRLKLRHHTVIVWSAGGVEWAETVVRTLGLTAYVDAVMCKPTYVFDDLPVEEFMPKSRLITGEKK